MRKKIAFASLGSIILLSACGGGNVSDGSKAALDATCTPSSGIVGTQTSCLLQDTKKIDEDCTFFFGGRPTDFFLDKDAGAFSFQVPQSISGSQEMTFQCGGEEPLSAGNFDVIPSVNPDEGSPSTTGDEQIQPTGTTGGTGSGDTTAGGTTGEGTTTGDSITTPAVSTSAAINSFTVTSVTGSSTRLNTFQISYSYSNAQAAYLWGNMLNRSAGDTYVDASERCKLQGGRYLATNPDGSDLVAGSDNYEKWQYAREGKICDDTTECLSQSTASAHFMVAQPKAVEASQTPSLPAVLSESSTNCRIDLNQADGTLVTGDTFYTVSQVQYGNLCLAVEGADGKWQVQCVSGDALNAKAADLDPYDPIKISPSTSKIGFDLSLKAVNATALQVFCTQDEGDLNSKTLTIDSSTGTAYYAGTCEVDAETKTFVVRVYGAGDNNVKQKTYTLTMDKPDVKLKLKGDAPGKDETSKIDLEYSATRHYAIVDEAGTVVSEGDAAWLKQRKFKGFKNAQDKDYLSGDKVDVTNPGQLSGTVSNVAADHDHAKWTFTVYDFDGKDYKDSYSVSKDTYTTSATLTKTDSGYGFGYGGEKGHDCSAAKDLNMWIKADWTAQNVASIQVLTDDCELSGDQPDPSQYGLQSGSLKVTKHMGKQNGSYDVVGICNIRFVYWDESWSDQSLSMEFQCKDDKNASLKGSVLENVVD